MKPFNLEDFLAGAPAETKSGLKVVDYKLWDEDCAYPLNVQLENKELISFTKQGKHSAHGVSDYDLVMSTQKRVIEGWVNVYKRRFGRITFDSKKEAIEFADGDSVYITTIKISHEIEE